MTAAKAATSSNRPILHEFSDSIESRRHFLRSYNAAAVGDVDNDGHPDLVRIAGSCFDVVKSNASGQLMQGQVVGPDGSGTVTYIDAGLADLDEDGNLDLVIADRDQNILRVLRGLGDGNFVDAVKISAVVPFQLLLVDVNNDKHVDIVVAGNSAFGGGSYYGISTFLNDGKAVFAAPTTVTGPIGLSQIAVVDYDGDLKPDLLALGSSLYLFKGAPGYSDGQRAIVNLSVPWQAFSVADFNRDGLVDLVASTSAGIAILLGSGAGNFAPNHAFNFASFAPFYGRIVVADLDGDKLPELVVRNVAGWLSGTAGAMLLRNISK